MMRSGEALLSSQHRPEILSLLYHRLASDQQVSLDSGDPILDRSESQSALYVRTAREEQL